MFSIKDNKSHTLKQKYLRVTKEGTYSVTRPTDANLISLMIKFLFPHSHTILDGTANMGGNTISFGRFFNKVIGIELDKSNYDALKYNTDTIKIYDNITIIHGNTLDYLEKLKYDLLFLDPPWGGKSYKKHSILDLKIGNVDIIDIIKKMGTLKKDGIILKLPSNFRLTKDYLSDNIMSIIKIANYYFAIIKFYST